MSQLRGTAPLRRRCVFARTRCDGAPEPSRRADRSGGERRGRPAHPSAPPTEAFSPTAGCRRTQRPTRAFGRSTRPGGTRPIVVLGTWLRSREDTRGQRFTRTGRLPLSDDAARSLTDACERQRRRGSARGRQALAPRGRDPDSLSGCQRSAGRTTATSTSASPWSGLKLRKPSSTGRPSPRVPTDPAGSGGVHPSAASPISQPTHPGCAEPSSSPDRRTSPSAGGLAQHVVFVVRKDVGCNPGFFYRWNEGRPGGAFWTSTDVGDTIRVWLVKPGADVLYIEGGTHASASPELERENEQIAQVSTELRIGRIAALDTEPASPLARLDGVRLPRVRGPSSAVPGSWAAP